MSAVPQHSPATTGPSDATAPAGRTEPGVVAHAVLLERACAGQELPPQPLMPWRTDPEADTGVPVLPTAEQAVAWAVYVGQRMDADAVFVVPVRAVGVRPERGRGMAHAPTGRAERAVTLAEASAVDPWEGARRGLRAELAAIPF